MLFHSCAFDPNERKFRSKHLEQLNTHGRRQLHVKWTESVTNCELSIGSPFILYASHVVHLFQTQHTHHTQYVGLANNCMHLMWRTWHLFCLRSIRRLLRMLPSAKIETMNRASKCNLSVILAWIMHLGTKSEANCNETQWRNCRMHIGRLHDACLQESRYTQLNKQWGFSGTYDMHTLLSLLLTG